MNTRDFRERLIDEVKKYPVLYDSTNEHHRDIEVRDRCWAEIAQRLEADLTTLKREWKILRDSLRQALKKTRGGATTKAGVPCKKWRFQQRMNFLLPHITLRGRRNARESHCKGENTDSGDDWSVNRMTASGAAEVEEKVVQDSGMELFFASVCASARRLPGPAQRELKRRVLDALLTAEASADLASVPATTTPPATSTLNT